MLIDTFKEIADKPTITDKDIDIMFEEIKDRNSFTSEELVEISRALAIHWNEGRVSPTYNINIQDLTLIINSINIEHSLRSKRS